MSRAIVNLAQPLGDPFEQVQTAPPLLTPAQRANIAGGFATGAGLADFSGEYPQFPVDDLTIAEMLAGQRSPSFAENVAAGRYFDAGLQGLGAAGDVLAATVPVVGAAAGSALKAPRVLVSAMRAMKASNPDIETPQQAADIIADMNAMQLTDLADATGVDATELLQSALTMENPRLPTLYHGTGADFDKHDLSKMFGSGTMQAHGRGFYTTETRDTARSYAQFRQFDFHNQYVPQKGTVADDLAEEYSLPRGTEKSFYEQGRGKLMSQTELDEFITEQVDPFAIETFTSSYGDKIYEFADGSSILLDQVHGPKASGGSKAKILEMEVDADVDQFIHKDRDFLDQPEFIQRTLVDYIDDVYQRPISEINPRENLQSIAESITRKERAFLNDYPELRGPDRPYPQVPETITEQLELLEGQEIAPVLGIADDSMAYGPSGTTIPPQGDIDDTLAELKELSKRGIKGIRYFDESYASDFRVELYDPVKHGGLYDDVQYVVTPRQGGYRASESKRQATSFHKTKDEAIANLGTRQNRYNYVVFDPEIITIAKKFSISIPVAAAMVHGANAEEYYQLVGEE